MTQRKGWLQARSGNKSTREFVLELLNFLSDIPGVGVLVKGHQTWTEYREHVFQQKLIAFLDPLSDLSDEERKSFAAKAGDPGEAERFGSTLLLLVEESEDFEKPRIYGRLYTACAQGHVPWADLSRLCKMVHRSFFEDLELLRSFAPGLQPDHKVQAQALSAQGFLMETGLDAGPHATAGYHYDLTPYGRQLVKFGLD